VCGLLVRLSGLVVRFVRGGIYGVRLGAGPFVSLMVLSGAVSDAAAWAANAVQLRPIALCDATRLGGFSYCLVGSVRLVFLLVGSRFWPGEGFCCASVRGCGPLDGSEVRQEFRVV